MSNAQKITPKNRRKILLCVAGLSPQIITESIYALTIKKKWIPDELYVVTTAEGAEQVENSLLPEGKGWLPKLISEYNLENIAFNKNHILVIEGREQQALEDIRSVEDNDAAADYITEVVKNFTSCEDTELHVSVAGGRKTMGVYLSFALTLYGRKRDKLSHVLVNAPFENSRHFFYPRKETDVISVFINRKEQFKDASKAEVTLAEIPFVRMRHLQQKDIVEQQYGYIDAVKQAQFQLSEAPTLTINLKNKTISVNDGVSHKMAPRELALLTLFARRRLNSEKRLTAPSQDMGDEALAKAYLTEYELITGRSIDIDASLKSAFTVEEKKGNQIIKRIAMTGADFSTRLSNFQKALKQKLGAGQAKPYLIDDGGTKPKAYELTIKKENIRIIEDRC